MMWYFYFSNKPVSQVCISFAVLCVIIRMSSKKKCSSVASTYQTSKSSNKTKMNKLTLVGVQEQVCDDVFCFRDADWELEPNAFQELLQRHDRCDVVTCVCKKGRHYDKRGG